jgi:hypothetical protein
MNVGEVCPFTAFETDNFTTSTIKEKREFCGETHNRHYACSESMRIWFQIWHVTVEALPKTHAVLNSLCTGMTVPYTIRTRIFGDSLRNKARP